MSAFFGLTGTLGFIVCLVLLVVKAIKKEPKKKVLIALAICFVVVGVAVSTDDNSNKNETTPKATIAPTSKPEATPSPTPAITPMPTITPIPTPETAEVDMDAVVDLIKMGLSNFDYATVEGDETGITVNVAGDGVAKSVAIAKLAGYDETYSDWVYMKEQMIKCSDSVIGIMKQCGIEAPLLVFNVLNDQNHDNVFLTLINSTVIYDVMEAE